MTIQRISNDPQAIPAFPVEANEDLQINLPAQALNLEQAHALVQELEDLVHIHPANSRNGQIYHQLLPLARQFELQTEWTSQVLVESILERQATDQKIQELSLRAQQLREDARKLRNMNPYGILGPVISLLSFIGNFFRNIFASTYTYISEKATNCFKSE